MDILQRALREALDRNAAETVRWTQYKEQHESAKANIEAFKKSLEVDIMVPIGTKALMPGRLYHTNEIVVSHSATYYSKCTAHKALEICENRMNVAATRLKALEDEANLHRNQLELPQNFDAFSSQEIIETYDEEVEKKWQVDHKRKMKEHKQKEALERQKLMNGNGEDDIIKRLEELELMEELENELEAISEEDDELVQAMLNERVEPVTNKKRTSHFNERNDEQVSSTAEHNEEGGKKENDDDDDDDDVDDGDDDDDDIPAEYKEFERRTESMPNKEKLKTFKNKLDEVQDYVRNLKPRSIEDISHKTDMIFLSDHLLSAIEAIEDEINCERYLNGENLITQDSDDVVSSDAFIPTSVPKETKTILKKNNSLALDDCQFDGRKKPSTMKKITFAAQDEVKQYNTGEEPNKLFSKKITFASEDKVLSFDGREEPSRITSSIIFDNGPVLQLNVNHSEAVFNPGNNEQSDVIRSPVDIYKQFAGCTVQEKIIERKRNPSKDGKFLKQRSEEAVTNQPKDELSPQVIKEEPKDQHDKVVAEAKTEVKEMLDNMFSSNSISKNTIEPDPLPEGNFVDAHEPKKRISLFKQRRQMKSQ